MDYLFPCNIFYTCLQVLKMYAWEPFFQEKVKNIRDQELKYLKKVAWLQGSTTFCWILAPYLVKDNLFQCQVVVVCNETWDSYMYTNRIH